MTRKEFLTRLVAKTFNVNESAVTYRNNEVTIDKDYEQLVFNIYVNKNKKTGLISILLKSERDGYFSEVHVSRCESFLEEMNVDYKDCRLYSPCIGFWLYEDAGIKIQGISEKPWDGKQEGGKSNKGIEKETEKGDVNFLIEKIIDILNNTSELSGFGFGFIF